MRERLWIVFRVLCIQIPLSILFFLCMITVVIPFGYWIVSGNTYTDLFEEILEMYD